MRKTIITSFLICLLVTCVGTNAFAYNPVPALAVSTNMRKIREEKENNEKYRMNEIGNNETSKKIEGAERVKIYDKKIGTKGKRNKIYKAKVEITVYIPQENKIMTFYLSNESDYSEDISYISVKINGKTIEYHGFSYVVVDM